MTTENKVQECTALPGTGGTSFSVKLENGWYTADKFIPQEPKTVYNNLPDIIKTVLIISEGWLVGSSIGHIFTGEVPKDYDIIVPDRGLLQQAYSVLTSAGFSHSFNSWSGLKFNKEDLEIDIWGEELDHFLKNASKFEYAYCLKSQILIKNI